MSFDKRLAQIQFLVQEQFPYSLIVDMPFLQRDARGCEMLLAFLMQIVPNVFGEIYFKVWTGPGPAGYLLYGVEFDTEQLINQELATEDELETYFSHGLLGLDWLAYTWNLSVAEGDEPSPFGFYAGFDTDSAELYHKSGSAEEIMQRLVLDIEVYLADRRFITQRSVIKVLEQRLKQAATEIQLHGYRVPRFVQLYFYISARLRAADALVLAGFYPDAFKDLYNMLPLCREMVDLPALKKKSKASTRSKK